METIENQFPKRITELRTCKGVSSRDMSLSIGMNANAVNSIESGRSYPRMESFFYICEYLGVTPAEFFDFDNQNPQALRELIDDMKKLNMVQLECIRMIVDAFLK